MRDVQKVKFMGGDFKPSVCGVCVESEGFIHGLTFDGEVKQYWRDKNGKHEKSYAGAVDHLGAVGLLFVRGSQVGAVYVPVNRGIENG